MGYLPIEIMSVLTATDLTGNYINGNDPNL